MDTSPGGKWLVRKAGLSRPSWRGAGGGGLGGRSQGTDVGFCHGRFPCPVQS